MTEPLNLSHPDLGNVSATFVNCIDTKAWEPDMLPPPFYCLFMYGFCTTSCLPSTWGVWEISGLA